MRGKNMKRYAMEELKEWKDSRDRKPMIVFGARQVGKTWLIREFGRTQYKNLIEIDFFTEPKYKQFFMQDLDPLRIIKALSSEFHKKIIPGETLIFFDEVQECAQAKTSLKYFREKASEYHVIAAGSYLGISTGGSFPVGNVDIMTLHPMSFFEFLESIERERLLDMIKSKDFQILRVLSSLLIEMMKTYFYVGGMPEAVRTFVETNDLSKVRKKQRMILSTYATDFSKHIPHDY
jgi:predicted AAA+ superfamily ATPase